MPYITRSERERAEWLSFNSALEHIQRSDACNRSEAQRQLLAALDERAVRSRHAFSDEAPHHPGGIGPAIWVPYDAPPDVGPTWAGARINDGGEAWADYRVTDEGRKQGVPCWRPVFVYRAQIEKHWPLANSALRRAVANTKVETEIGRWLEGFMRASPDRATPKRELLKQATEKWPGKQIGRAFDRAWKAAGTTTGAVAWSAAGRPKKSPLV